MKKVDFLEVSEVFSDVWCNGAENLFCQIAWDCLDKAGMTSYQDEKTYAKIYVYAHVIQMLVEEFSWAAYDEPCAYEYETAQEEPLTDAAIGWLYRDALVQRGCEDADGCFMADPAEMLRELIFETRHEVADVIFDAFGEYNTGKLLFFTFKGKPLEEDYDDEDMEEAKPFATKEELLSYCKDTDYYFFDSLYDANAMRLQHWLECHSCT